MKKIKIIVKGNRASLYGRVNLIAGTAGQACEFYFDDEWKDLNKQVSYKVGSTVMGTYNINNNEAIIPPSVLMTAGLPLEIGVMGYSNDKSTIIPTSWCYIDVIQNGTVSHPNGENNNNDGYHVIYDGGTVEYTSSPQHIIYDGGVII